MKEQYIKQLDDHDLIDAIRHARDVVDLCVHGISNYDHAPSAEGLYWAKDDLNLLTEELEQRFLNKKEEVTP